MSPRPNQRRNRSGIEGFVICLFISPLIAFLIVAILKTLPERVDTRSAEEHSKYDKRRQAVYLTARPFVSLALFVALLGAVLFGAAYLIEEQESVPYDQTHVIR